VTDSTQRHDSSYNKDGWLLIQAEAEAMLLGLLAADKLQIRSPTVLKDNRSLALAVASNRVDSHHIHWNSREFLARILNSMSNFQGQIFHIKRDLNGVADNCAIRC
jgi:hypothetical protein